MSDTVLLPASELLHHFAASGITLKVLAQAVLECTPVNTQGDVARWPAARTLSVHDLLRQPVKSPHWLDQPAVPGLNIMSTVVAERAIHSAMFQRRDQDQTMAMSAVQVEEVFKATVEFVRPHLREPVAPLFRETPALDGFFHSYCGHGPAELEQLLAAHSARDERKPLRRVLDVPFEGHRLVAWRQPLGVIADEGERLTDIHAVLYGVDDEQLAYCRLRHVVLAPGTVERDLVFILDAYDSQGLELGTALRAAVAQDRLDPALLDAGLSLLQLQEMEVHPSLRGQALGMRMLKQVLPAAMKRQRHQPQLLVMAVKPMQFSFPLVGYPVEIQLEALDAVSKLQEHFQAYRPQDQLASLRGTEPLYLGVDPRASAGHFEQLQVLADEYNKA